MKTDEIEKLLAEAPPGPWKYVPGHTDAIIDANGATIVFDEFGFLDDPGARLIAMAPDIAAEVVRLREALEPFSKMAGELFARNYNKEDMVIALDTPERANRLTFGDFLSARAALEGRE